jgi:uncharacterized membrane protein
MMCDGAQVGMENLHPLTVHFPIALLPVALLIETLAVLFKKASWHRIALWNLALGTLGAAVAVFTGRQAAATAKHSFEIHPIMVLHERLGYVVLALAVVIAGWRLLRRDALSRRGRWMAWGLLGLACGILAFSAHWGGRMVYEFGVGGSYGRSSGIEVITHGEETSNHVH